MQQSPASVAPEPVTNFEPAYVPAALEESDNGLTQPPATARPAVEPPISQKADTFAAAYTVRRIKTEIAAGFRLPVPVAASYDTNWIPQHSSEYFTQSASSADVDPLFYDEVQTVNMQTVDRRVMSAQNYKRQTYTRRQDDAFRLEGAVDGSSAPLPAGRSIDELKPSKSSFSLPAATEASHEPTTAPAAPSPSMFGKKYAPPEVKAIVPPHVSKPALVSMPHFSMEATGSPAMPKVGDTAIAAAHFRREEVQILRVQAGGRRVIVSYGKGTRVYSRRKDSSYRLEGAPNSSKAQLIVDKTLDELMVANRANLYTRYNRKHATA